MDLGGSKKERVTPVPHAWVRVVAPQRPVRTGLHVPDGVATGPGRAACGESARGDAGQIFWSLGERPPRTRFGGRPEGETLRTAPAAGPMSILDELLDGNRRFRAKEWDPTDSDLGAPPAKRLAVVACMDTRYNVEKVLGLAHGDAKIIRNAGNMIDDGTLRSLLVAVHLLKVERIAVMGHTRCGMTLVGRGDFQIANSINETTGIALNEVMRPDFQRWLGGFTDVAENVRRSLDILRNHPYLPDTVELIGLVYDNANGRVDPVDRVIGADDARHPTASSKST